MVTGSPCFRDKQLLRKLFAERHFSSVVVWDLNQTLNTYEMINIYQAQKWKVLAIVILFACPCVIVSCVAVSIFVVCIAYLSIYVCVCVCVCQVIVHEVPGQELEVEVFDKDPDQDDFLGR